MKERLDQILLNLDFVENKNKARSLIMDGKVIVNNEKITKPGTMFNKEKIKININHEEMEFVSRAGKKLDAAIKKWKINLNGKVCLDIGSSTGGFTDCCLQNNASYVFAVDVGTNQLDWKLRNDNRVCSLENTNFRYIKKEMVNKEIDFFCCDVSFISISKILEPLSKLIQNDTTGVVLIKPQFECDKEDVKNGKINSKESHIKAITRVIEYAKINGFSIKDIYWSPILGNKKKNIEYICYIIKKNDLNYNLSNVENLVKECWTNFYGK
ncbi:rRNA methyltransferase [Spiroplasma corruscae]|uniref:rRNA methyltransferase n=1 Tax=Spiroplasma corruscae TaxID=216934 RepID=A0A222EP47_9MOLU|nr:TlyA family RNA methyltransferase [Spiroplasma corruscae]ASP28252.1 rRNA methyltransferase [Spiroplasma corruscae]